MTVTKISEEFSMISSNVEKGFWGSLFYLKLPTSTTCRKYICALVFLKPQYNPEFNSIFMQANTCLMLSVKIIN